MRKLFVAGAALALAVGGFGTTAAHALDPNTPIGAFTLSSTTATAGEPVVASLPLSTPSVSFGVPCMYGDVFVEVDGKIVPANVESNGRWSATITAPANTGTYPVSASCDMYGQTFHYDSVALTVTPAGNGGSDAGPGADTGTDGLCETIASGPGGVGSGFQPHSPDQLNAGNAGGLQVAAQTNNGFMLKLDASCASQVLFMPVFTNAANYQYDFHSADSNAAGEVTFSMTGFAPTEVAAGTYKLGVYQANSHLIGWITGVKSANGNWSFTRSEEAPNPTPTAPAAPAAPAESQLTSASAGSVSIASVVGSQVRLNVGVQFAGQTVYGTVFSTPQSLGAAVVDANGFATFTLPAGLEAGMHKVAVQNANGELVGWAAITLSADGSWSAETLADTGAGSASSLGLAAALLMGAGVVTLVARRRSAAQRAE